MSKLSCYKIVIIDTIDGKLARRVTQNKQIEVIDVTFAYEGTIVVHFGFVCFFIIIIIRIR